MIEFFWEIWSAEGGGHCGKRVDVDNVVNKLCHDEQSHPECFRQLSRGEYGWSND